MIVLQLCRLTYARKMTQTLTNAWRPLSSRLFQNWARDTQNSEFRPLNHSSCRHWKLTTARAPPKRSALTWSLRTSRSWVSLAQWLTLWKSTWTTTNWPARLASQNHSWSPDSTRLTARCSYCRSPETERATLSWVSIFRYFVPMVGLIYSLSLKLLTL